MATNKASLEIGKGLNHPQSVVFPRKTIHIGSLYAENDVVLNVEGMSARHARIRRNKKDFDVSNLSDKPFMIGQGICLNSRETMTVQSGTEVDMGAVTVRLIHDKAPNPSGDKQITPKPKQDRHRPWGLALNRSGIKRSAGIGGIAVVLFLVAVLAGNCVKKNGKSNDRPLSFPTAMSRKPIGLPAKGIYGYTRDNDKDHPDKAVFTFETDATNVELYYTAGGIDSEKEVAILLNGQPVGYAPPAKGVWGPQAVVRLPKKALKKDGVNTLVFDNRENPPNMKLWAVRNIRILPLPENLCDLDRAGELLKLGQEMYALKDVSKGNLYRAHRYFSEAVSFTQDCSKEEERCRQAGEKQARTGQALDALHHDLSFAFQKAYKMNNYDQCIRILRDIVLYFPDPLDERYKEAAKILEKYTQDEQEQR